MTAGRTTRPVQAWTMWGFNVASRECLETWTVWLDELGIEHTGIRSGDDPSPWASLVFRDPDNIQLELFVVR